MCFTFSTSFSLSLSLSLSLSFSLSLSHTHTHTHTHTPSLPLSHTVSLTLLLTLSLKASLTDMQDTLERNSKEAAELPISTRSEQKRADEQAAIVAIEVVEADIAAAAVKVSLLMVFT